MVMGWRRPSVLASRMGRRTPTEMEAEGRSRTLRRRRQLPGRRVPATPRRVASARRASRAQDRLAPRAHYHRRRDQPVIEAAQGAADQESHLVDESAGIGGGSADASSRMFAWRTVGRLRARPETARHGSGPRFRPGGQVNPVRCQGGRASDQLVEVRGRATAIRLVRRPFEQIAVRLRPWTLTQGPYRAIRSSTTGAGGGGSSPIVIAARTSAAAASAWSRVRAWTRQRGRSGPTAAPTGATCVKPTA